MRTRAASPSASEFGTSQGRGKNSWLEELSIPHCIFFHKFHQNFKPKFGQITWKNSWLAIYSYGTCHQLYNSGFLSKLTQDFSGLGQNIPIFGHISQLLAIKSRVNEYKLYVKIKKHRQNTTNQSVKNKFY